MKWSRVPIWKRAVVKVGSSIVAPDGKGCSTKYLLAIARFINESRDQGKEVILVEKLPYLGGQVARMNEYFPKLCPPYCGLEINFKRIRNNPRISVITGTVVENITEQKLAERALREKQPVSVKIKVENFFPGAPPKINRSP